MVGTVTYVDALEDKWWPAATGRERLAGGVIKYKTLAYIVVRIADWILWDKGNRVSATLLSVGTTVTLEGTSIYHIRVSRDRTERALDALRGRIEGVRELWDELPSHRSGENERAMALYAVDLLNPARTWELNDLASAHHCLPIVPEADSLSGTRRAPADLQALVDMGENTQLEKLRPHFDRFSRLISETRELKSDHLAKRLRNVWLLWAAVGICWSVIRLFGPSGSPPLPTPAEPLLLPQLA